MSFASRWLAYILPDFHYIQRSSEVMTSCPRVRMSSGVLSLCVCPPPGIECYQVCSSRHSLVWMVRSHSGRWVYSGAVCALHRGRNSRRGGNNVILNGIFSRTRSLAHLLSLGDPAVFNFGVLGFSFSYWTSLPEDPVVPTYISWVMSFGNTFISIVQ